MGSKSLDFHSSMVDPTILCNQHISAEHQSLHGIVTRINEGYPVDDIVADFVYLKERHDSLAREMVRREGEDAHDSPIEDYDMNKIGIELLDNKIPEQAALMLLIENCPVCRGRWAQREGLDALSISLLGKDDK